MNKPDCFEEKMEAILKRVTDASISSYRGNPQSRIRSLEFAVTTAITAFELSASLGRVELGMAHMIIASAAADDLHRAFWNYEGKMETLRDRVKQARSAIAAVFPELPEEASV